MRAITLSLLFVLMLISGISFSGFASGKLTGDRVSFGRGYRYDKNGWIFVHIEGKPFDRGFQHGYLLAEEIKEALRVNSYFTKWSTGEDFNFFVKASESMFTSKVDREFLTEIQGIAAGARKAGVKVTYQEIMAWNGISELLGYWWPQIMR